MVQRDHGVTFQALHGQQQFVGRFAHPPDHLLQKLVCLDIQQLHLQNGRVAVIQDIVQAKGKLEDVLPVEGGDEGFV